MFAFDAGLLAAAALRAGPAEFVTGTPLGKLLVALVVLALVLFVGRFVLGVAWKLLRIAIVVVALLWLLSVVVPALG